MSISSPVEVPNSAEPALDSATAVTEPHRMPVPATASPSRVRWDYLTGLFAVHLLSLLAFHPWFFSWSGVVMVVVCQHLFGMLGITLGYHRLLTHRGFSCPRWFERTLALLGLCNLQDSPARWVAIHRQHHQYSDEQTDPHTPLVSFWWSHVGWLLIRNRDHESVAFYDRYVKDLLRDPFYMRLERRSLWAWVYVVHAVLIFLIGLTVGWIAFGTYARGAQFGLSWLVWGVFVRTVFIWHGTWAVNSITHVWGYRTYKTGDNSRNNWLVALLSYGEGWHNNHHAEQRAAAHGHRWWEFDLTWLLIWCLERIGLIHDVVRPKLWQQKMAAETK